MPSSNPFRFRSRRAAPLRALLSRRLGAWARRRQGEDCLPLELHRRRLYILPTRLGAATAVLLFLMLLGGLNYNNSLALLLCFMLSGFVLVSMYDCHRTLSGLRLRQVRVEDAFAGQRGSLTVAFENPGARERLQLRIACGPAPPSHFALAPAANASIRLAYQAVRRGLQPLDRLELSSIAPLGLFRCWTWVHLPLQALVYPQPRHWRALPAPMGEPRSSSRRLAAGGEEEWAWLRPFRVGDSPRAAAWKAYAHGGPLLVAQYEAPAGSQHVLDFEQLAGLGVEQRLSQLADWVLECERRGEAYALRLPGMALRAQSGRAHRRACLRALARYGT